MTHTRGRLTWRIKSPAGGDATLEGERIPCRNGHMRLATIALKEPAETVIQQIRLERA